MIDKKDTECIFKFVGIIGCGVVFSLAGISLFVSVLIHGITEVYEVISQKRMNKFIDEFNKNIQRIDENNINKNFLKTEEFYDFFFC